MTLDKESKPKVKAKYLSAPGAGNRLYLPRHHLGASERRSHSYHRR